MSARGINQTGVGGGEVRVSVIFDSGGGGWLIPGVLAGRGGGIRRSGRWPTPGDEAGSPFLSSEWPSLVGRRLGRRVGWAPCFRGVVGEGGGWMLWIGGAAKDGYRIGWLGWGSLC